LIPGAKEALAEALKAGNIVMPEEILPGIERYPEALSFMFRGGNLGKLMVRV
jgi:NADPH-dependent curcumin reductase CurA